MSETIFLVDDEQHIIDLAKMYLEQANYTVTSTTDGQIALARILAEKPALVVLDLMLPGLDGWEVCRRVRAQSDVPIIMLTARTEDVDRIVGLELGADDYLTKPFNPRELVARVRAILRRASPRPAAADEGTPIVIGNLSIYPERRLALVENRPVDLRMKEFDLLLALAQNPGVVFSREKLLDVVWGFDFAGETRTVDVHIAHLRHKLAGMQAGIETVWGVGYKLEMA
ncbi:MAG: DNA-binding response regulator [Chloroflexi bacterium]|nr:DNA-binding response regulator [Chloroflexota bacterium]MDL1885166.1 response regulator transcription factor [Anaerolineae bacterium CFX8]